MRKSIEIKLDKVRNLRFDTNALILLEDLSGKSITKLDFNNIGIKDVRLMLYCGLKHDDKSLTQELTGELMDEVELELIVAKIGEALNLAFGKGESVGK
jgi:hypothetical protein